MLGEAITSTLNSGLNLEEYTEKEKREILIIITGYLLGDATYSETYKGLNKHGLDRRFSLFLRGLGPDVQKYILFFMRKYAYKTYIGSDSASRAKKFLCEKDYKLVDTYLSSGREPVEPIRQYPTEEYMIKAALPKIRKIANEYEKGKKKRENVLDFQEMISSLGFKAIATYRLYIYSYGIGNFNDSVFFSCILRSLTTGKLDLISCSNRKRRNPSNTISFSLLEEIENSKRAEWSDHHGLVYSIDEEFLSLGNKELLDRTLIGTTQYIPPYKEILKVLSLRNRDKGADALARIRNFNAMLANLENTINNG